MGKKEKVIEDYLIKEVEKLGGLCVKLSSPGNNGWPDRVCAMPLGFVVWIEVKAPGKEPGLLQLYYLDELQKRSHWAGWVSTTTDVDKLITTMKGELDDRTRKAAQVRRDPR